MPQMPELPKGTILSHTHYAGVTRNSNKAAIGIGSSDTDSQAMRRPLSVGYSRDIRVVNNSSQNWPRFGLGMLDIQNFATPIDVDGITPIQPIFYANYCIGYDARRILLHSPYYDIAAGQEGIVNIVPPGIPFCTIAGDTTVLAGLECGPANDYGMFTCTGSNAGGPYSPYAYCGYGLTAISIPDTTTGYFWAIMCPAPNVFEGALTSTLAAPTNGWTGPTICTASAYRPDPANPGQFIVDPLSPTYTIINRDTSLPSSGVAAIGTYVRWMLINGENRLIWTAC